MYFIEQKLFFRSADVFVFNLCMPVAALVLIAMIAGSKTAGDSGMTYLQSAFASLVSVGICCSAFMSIPIVIVDYRDKKILKHFYCSPCSPVWILGADTICSVVMAVISAILVSVTAIVCFGYRMQGNPVEFIGAWGLTFVDEENGYRYYTMDQMAVLHQIMALKQAGFTLEDIRRLKEGTDEKTFLTKKKIEILSKISELTRQITIIDRYLSDAEMSLDTPVLIRTIPAVIAATMQKRIESYDALFDLMPMMDAEMERLGCECAIPEYCFTHYLEPEFKEEQILIETCEAVTEKKEDSELVKFKEFPEIQAACIYHKGFYDDFPRSYAVLLKYIEENGYEICGNIRENYIDGVWNKDTEEEWLSEIQIPVKKLFL